LFVDQNRICGLKLSTDGSSEDGLKHNCVSKFLPSFSSALISGLSTNIKSLSIVGGKSVYTCYDLYCPPAYPTLRENGICAVKLEDCYKKSMKLTVKIAVNDYRFYCL
jgi:hypothetical protein